jgi:hypothetical protein
MQFCLAYLNKFVFLPSGGASGGHMVIWILEWFQIWWNDGALLWENQYAQTFQFISLMMEEFFSLSGSSKLICQKTLTGSAIPTKSPTVRQLPGERQQPAEGRTGPLQKAAEVQLESHSRSVGRRHFFCNVKRKGNRFGKGVFGRSTLRTMSARDNPGVLGRCSSVSPARPHPNSLSLLVILASTSDAPLDFFPQRTRAHRRWGVPPNTIRARWGGGRVAEKRMFGISWALSGEP